MGHTTHTGSYTVKVFMLFPHLAGKTRSFDIAELLIQKQYIAEPRLLGLGAQFLTFDKKKRIGLAVSIHHMMIFQCSDQMQSQLSWVCKICSGYNSVT